MPVLFNSSLAIWPFDMIGMPELVIILIVAVLLFGKKLPQFGRWLGESLVEFKKGVAGMKDEIEKAGQEDSAVSDTTYNQAQMEDGSPQNVLTENESDNNAGQS